MRIAAIAFAALMLAPVAVSAGSISCTIETDNDGQPQSGLGCVGSGFETFSKRAVAADRGFHVIVSC